MQEFLTFAEKPMKKTILLLFILLHQLAMAQGTANFHDFQVQTINGTTLSLSDFKGKKVLVVNVASECGLTPQYETLQELYDEFGGSNFVIIGFPANNFGAQEPGSNEEIQTFCKKNYGVTFPMMAKIDVKGDNIAPLYAWLTQKTENGVEDAPVSWNFQKFMIDENGEWVGMVSPQESPACDKIVNWITAE
jgi:glutathione peroxidase